MANLSSNTNLTIPRGAVVKFGLGGIGQAIDESGTYKLGNQEVILGPYPVAKTITVLVQSTVRYVIDTDGVIDTSVPLDPITPAIDSPTAKDAMREIVLPLVPSASSVISGPWATPVNDVDGDKFDAHGGGMLVHKGVYYWFGESKYGTTTSGFVPTHGVNCYKSLDGKNWTFAGNVLKANYYDASSDIHTSKVLERPKVIYNESTGKFVMIFHADNQAYTFAKIGIAVADRPDGDYVFQGSYRPIPDLSSYPHRDITVFKDDDGKAVIFVDVHDGGAQRSLYAMEMDASYTGFTGVYSQAIPFSSREAPAVFKRGSRYWMINSGMTGWSPNPTRIYYADALMGPWTDAGDFCRNDAAATSYGSQSTFVLPVDKAVFGYEFVAMFDKWVSADLETSSYLWLPVLIDSGTGVPYVDNTYRVPAAAVRDDWSADLNPESPVFGQEVLAAARYALKQSAALASSGLIWNFDCRDYDGAATTWAARVGSGNIPVVPAHSIKRRKNVHLSVGANASSTITPFSGSGLTEWTVEFRFKVGAKNPASDYGSILAVNAFASPYNGVAINRLRSTDIVGGTSGDKFFRVSFTGGGLSGTNAYYDLDASTEWVNIKFVRTATSLKLWVNRQLVTTINAAASALVSNGAIQIGNYDGNTRQCEVTASFLRIYNRALSDAEALSNADYDYANFN